jgi:hypothetical protein
MNTSRKFFLGFVLTIVFLLSTALSAQEREKREGIHVARSAICIAVQDHEPIGIDSTFSATVGSLYCFTRIEGATDTTSVTHVWYYGEKKMSEVTLAVKSLRWRTFSNKKIQPTLTGKWNVVVLSEAGDPLAQIPFYIKPSEPE